MLQMILSAFFFAVMAAFARLAGARLPAQEVVLARAGIASAITIVLLVRGRAPILGRRPGLLAVRGVTGFLSLSCQFWAVTHLPFAEAVLLAQTNPVFTALLAWAFLGERPGALFAPALVLVFAGVFATVPFDPARVSDSPWALVALAGAVFAGSAYTEVRALSRSEHPLTIVFWFQFISVLLALPGTFASGVVVPRGIEWAWVVGVGVTGQLGQVCLTRGLQRVAAGRGTLANPLVVAFGALAGWTLFGEPLGWNVLAGGALIVSGLLVAGMDRRSPEAVGAPGEP